MPATTEGRHGPGSVNPRTWGHYTWACRAAIRDRGICWPAAYQPRCAPAAPRVTELIGQAILGANVGSGLLDVHGSGAVCARRGRSSLGA
jgi:hypothetical protein